MVLLEAGKLAHRNYVNIWGLNELRGIEATGSHITLGALTTYTEVQSDPILRREFPMLCQAASETGGLAIQNRGTLGGNIVNASPAADSPPALLAYDAEIELVSTRGSRWLPYQGFHTGYKQMHIDPDELLARIRLPRNTSESDALLSQSRYAKSSGDLESMFRCSRQNRTRADHGHEDRRGKCCSYSRAMRADRRHLARTKARRRNHQGSRRKPFARNLSH